MGDKNKCEGPAERCAADTLDFIAQTSFVPGTPKIEIAYCHNCGRLYRRNADNHEETWLLSTPGKGDALAMHPYSGREIAC